MSLIVHVKINGQFHDNIFYFCLLVLGTVFEVTFPHIQKQTVLPYSGLACSSNGCIEQDNLNIFTVQHLLSLINIPSAHS